MLRPNKIALAAAFALIALGGYAWAQFTTELRLVVLHASVTDKHGKLITDLSRDAFRVLENGQPQELKVFKREDVPVSLGLIIDDSGSMRTKRERVEAASMTLVKESNPQDEVFIVNFNDEPYLDVPFTNDPKKMEQGLTRIDSRGGTAMRDAIDLSMNYLKSDGKRDKKALLVITDGNDNASNVSLERIVQKAQQWEVLVYAVGLLADEEKREASKAKRDLKALTNATGGLVYYPASVSDVRELCETIARDIRNQYTLAYTPQVADDGTYRTIKVMVNGQSGYTVRTRSGYYARRETQKDGPPPKPGSE
jgi:Ca-activated chloride channel family protein